MCVFNYSLAMNYTCSLVPVGDAIDAGDDLITVNVGARACTEIKQ